MKITLKQYTQRVTVRKKYENLYNWARYYYKKDLKSQIIVKDAAKKLGESIDKMVWDELAKDTEEVVFHATIFNDAEKRAVKINNLINGGTMSFIKLNELVGKK